MKDYTFKQLIDDVKKITNKYVGKVDKKGYKHIAEDIAAHIDTLEFVSELKSDLGVVMINTEEDEEQFITDTSNIGEKYIIIYHINFKPDKRSTTNGVTGKILSIDVESQLPEKFLDWDIVDIPQAIHYMLAKEHRERCLREIKELQEQLQSYQEGVNKFESIMKSESWNEKMLFADLKE